MAGPRYTSPTRTESVAPAAGAPRRRPLCAARAQSDPTVHGKEHLMSFLRFTPQEYGALAAVCERLDLGSHGLPAFRRLLAVALAETHPQLARRVDRLRRGEAELLYHHFRPRPPAAVRHDLTDEELSAFAQACGAAALPVRFVRPFQAVLVE